MAQMPEKSLLATQSSVYTGVTFEPRRRRASLLLTVTLSALCEQLKLEIRGDAQAPDFSVAKF